MVDFNRILSGLSQSGIASGLAGGLAGGALTGALMSKKGRKTAGTVLKVGGVAAVGGLAWKAYQNYQQGQGGKDKVAANPNFAVLPAEQFEGSESGSAPLPETSLLLIRAMIAAAMADGHLDAGEQNRIFDQAGELGLSDSDKAVLFDELRNPRSVEVIAADARDPALAVEVYAASLLAIDESTAAAKTYLNELALRLNLPSQLVEAVHQQTSDNTAARSAA